ncbi:hypothetical protein [Vibrio phage CKB-S2]|nr:hypothetical protein [Vibrio phage CKB-S2]
MPTTNTAEQYVMAQVEAEQARIDELAKLLEPKVKELLPTETATFRIAAAIAERLSYGKILSMKVERNQMRCCDSITFEVSGK